MCHLVSSGDAELRLEGVHLCQPEGRVPQTPLEMEWNCSVNLIEHPWKSTRARVAGAECEMMSACQQGNLLGAGSNSGGDGEPLEGSD